MNKLRTIGLIALATVVLGAGAYAVFGFVLVSADRATYTASTTTDFDYDTVLATAEAEGFAVETVDSVGFHPEGIDELDATLGPDYEVARIVFYHEDGGHLDATVFADEGITELAYWKEDAPQALPPESWLVDRISLLFDIDDATAEGYVDEMRAAIDDDDVPIPQTTVNDRIEFAAAYEEFDSTPSTTRTGTPGQGWVEWHYTSGSRPVGELHFIVGRAELTHSADGRTYTLNVDRTGGVGVTVQSSDRDIPRDELREGVRELFETVGIPPKAAADLTFEYDSSVW